MHIIATCTTTSTTICIYIIITYLGICVYFLVMEYYSIGVLRRCQSSRLVLAGFDGVCESVFLRVAADTGASIYLVEF